MIFLPYDSSVELCFITARSAVTPAAMKIVWCNIFSGFAAHAAKRDARKR